MPGLSSARLGFLALLAGATGIAFAPLWVRASELGPGATAFYRLLFALPVLWVWLSLERRQAPPPTSPRGWRDHGLLVVTGLFFAADMAVWNWSVKLTSVAHATLFPNLAPIFVTLGARVLLGEPIRPRFLAGMALALLGAGLLVQVSLGLTTRHLWGDALGVVTAVVYAGYMLGVKRLRARFSTATIMAWSGLASCAGLGWVAWVSGEAWLATSLRGWLVLVALALVSQVLGQGLIAYGFAHLPASFASLCLLFQPVVAAALAWLLLGEAVNARQAFGGLLVLTGIGWAGWRRRGAAAVAVAVPPKAPVA